jgi:hypothetical protein
MTTDHWARSDAIAARARLLVCGHNWWSLTKLANQQVVGRDAQRATARASESWQRLPVLGVRLGKKRLDDIPKAIMPEIVN